MRVLLHFRFSLYQHCMVECSLLRATLNLEETRHGSIARSIARDVEAYPHVTQVS